MGVKWTEEQQKVIDLRDRNILVSAAAGSGKTAVLVERIIKRITEDTPPVDIDKILVVTFTKAAAAEMRERISRAIENKREENPQDSNLEKQAALIHNAQISTIDSFCLYVVRNHFGEINLDPNFRIADPGEIKLLEQDVMDELFELNYVDKENEKFIALVDKYSNSRSDDDVRCMVSDIYKMACSDSWPKEWMKSLGKLYNVEDVAELLESEFIKGIVMNSIRILCDLKDKLIDIYEIAQSTDGLEKYAALIADDLVQFENLDELNSFDDLQKFVSSISMKSAPGGKSKADTKTRDYVKNRRNSVKEEIGKLKEAYFNKSSQEIFEQISNQKEAVDELVRLAISYFDLMQDKKQKMHIADFSDIEHFALKILVDEETKELTSTAVEFREQFEEIMIDEYQDSNQVQEDIMRAISRENIGHNNIFMVGDVKQSIYRFRMARPELFMEKYDSYKLYTQGDDSNQRIDLHKNFRSRNTVLNYANDIFYKIMQTDLGKVAYDDKSALYEGATYPEADNMEAELLLVNMADDDIGSLVQKEGESTRQIEALMVANKINDIVGKLYVTDKESGNLRLARYSDIVVLMRSISADGPVFANVFSDCGIPSYVELSTGYFSAYEIQVILNFLKILDNPYQDIPMAAVLKSPIAGLDDEELAQIKAENKELDFCKAVLEEMQKEDSLLAEFGIIYEKLRSQVKDTSIHVLIQNILDETDFLNFASAMPSGNRRRQNINMLLEKAVDYEKTSYKGLFHFVRYIEELRKYEVDFGEADTSGENDDVVRIMTIHKSKGLEFPIAIVAGLGKSFNLKDADGKMVLHSDYGIGLKQILLNPKRMTDSIVRAQISKKIKEESLGEELRVLYVALTRAKEKLILSGTMANAEKKFQGYVGNSNTDCPISYSQRVDAKCYLDWIIPALLSYPDKYTIDFVSAENLAQREAIDLAKKDVERQELFERIDNVTAEQLDILEKSFSFVYKYASDATKKSKYSVSELKHDSMLAKYDKSTNEAEIPEFLKEPTAFYVPSFAYTRNLDLTNSDLRDDDFENVTPMKEQEQEGSSNAVNTNIINVNVVNANVNPGALRGTAIHRVMECLDFAAINSIDVTNKDSVKSFVKAQIDQMYAKGLLTEEMRSYVIPSMIEKFVSSDIALRMAKAAQIGELYKEKPFVMSKEDYLVQGIIDVFWIEDDKIIVLDYKTDSVKEAKELVLRYKTQLELYADALERIFTTDDKRMTAEERLIYSFKLQEVVSL